jgi:hypothetical protein
MFPLLPGKSIIVRDRTIGKTRYDGVMSESSGQPPFAPDPRRTIHPPTAPAALLPRTGGRCDQCGYSLVGLPQEGVCPECGETYTSLSAQRLKPWPTALETCARLGWPVLGLLLAGAMVVSKNDLAVILGMVLTWVMIVSLALNSYLQVRIMLKRSLPEKVRTRGPVAILRTIGTTLCVIVLLAFVGGPLLGAVACLVILSHH